MVRIGSWLKLDFPRKHPLNQLDIERTRVDENAAARSPAPKAELDATANHDVRKSKQKDVKFRPTKWHMMKLLVLFLISGEHSPQ